VKALALRAPLTVYRAALLAMVLVLIVVAYYPFAWDPPRVVSNGVTRSADGSLQFGAMNNARTHGTPAWLQEARTSGVVQVRLRFEPRSADEDASIMMLGSNVWDTDFAIGQDGSVLLVWLRRPQSDADGNPPLGFGGVIRPQRWDTVELTLQQEEIRIVVNGSTLLFGYMTADPTKLWGQGRIALGNQVHGGGAWQGKIGLAEVTTPGYTVNYVRPGALSIPRRYFYFPDHVIPFPPSGQDWLDFSADMLSFTPVGFLIVFARRPPVRLLPASVLAALLAVVLAGGKFLFHGRHTAVTMVVMEAAGGLLGALLAHWLSRTKSPPLEAAVGPAPSTLGGP
jgi:hypothetical protein